MVSKRKQSLEDFFAICPPAFNEAFLKVKYLEAIEKGLIGKTVQFSSFKHRITDQYQIYEEAKIDKYVIYHKKGLKIHEILSYMNENSYLSYYTAMNILGLTDQVPKEIFVTLPQKRKAKEVTLTQSDIDQSFSKPFIKSQNIITFNDLNNIYILHTMDNYKEKCHETSSIYGFVRTSSYEKTLIDITVRPEYSGGIYEVIEAYRRASFLISGSDLTSILRKQSYIYPYHQAIGFYMDLAGGYSKSVIRSLKNFQLNRDFYLFKGLKKEDSFYNENWKIFYPKDINL
jgi:hypothetical protein